MTEKSIAALNKLLENEKTARYSQFIPDELLKLFKLAPNPVDSQGRSLLQIHAPVGSTDVEIILHHEYAFEDPILYAHLTDTMNAQLHILLYVVNDPSSERFDVDRMPDGSPTQFGTNRRNLEEELRAMQAGLAPGQIRRGLRIMRNSIQAFEAFVRSLSHDLYFIEPLYYHNAIMFERYGFSYQQGRRRMEAWNASFQPGGSLHDALDDSSPFRTLDMHSTVRGRSWALHDGLAGERFDRVTMYKRVGEMAEVQSFPGANW
jgi:hypothetical protein